MTEDQDLSISLDPLQAIVYWQNIRIRTYKIFHTIHEEMLESSENEQEKMNHHAHDHHDHHDHSHGHNQNDSSVDSSPTAKKMNMRSLKKYQIQIAHVTQKFNECNNGVKDALSKIEAFISQNISEVKEISSHNSGEISKNSKNWDTNLVKTIEDLLYWEKSLFQSEVKRMRFENINKSSLNEDFVGEKSIPYKKELSQILQDIGEARENINDLMSEIKLIIAET